MKTKLRFSAVFNKWLLYIQYSHAGSVCPWTDVEFFVTKPTQRQIRRAKKGTKL